MEWILNTDCNFYGGDRMGDEFKYVEKYVKEGKGVDLGCGTNRLSMSVLAIDANPMREFAHADIVHDCKDLDIGVEKEFNGMKYNFQDGELDFIFSSHCLEDFEDIPAVFMNWWKKLKKNGLMILLLPDMEICNCELCKSEDQQRLKINQGMSARYWTLEDYEKTGKGNPSHRTNVGKKFINDMLQKFKEKHELDYEIIQQDTIPHNVSCTIDFVIKKK